MLKVKLRLMHTVQHTVRPTVEPWVEPSMHVPWVGPGSAVPIGFSQAGSPAPLLRGFTLHPFRDGVT